MLHHRHNTRVRRNKSKHDQENRTPIRQFGEIGDAHHSGESASDGKENLRSLLLNRNMTSNERDRKLSAIFAPPSTQLEALTQSMRELTGKNSIHPTDGNEFSERPRPSAQRSDIYQSLINENSNKMAG